MRSDLCNAPASAEPTPRLGELPGFESRYRSLSGGLRPLRVLRPPRDAEARLLTIWSVRPNGLRLR